MADSVADIIINVKANATEAVNGLQQLKVSAQQTAASAGGQLATMTNNIGNRVNQAGDRITKFGQNIKKSIGTDAALAFGVAGAAATSFMKKCISSAISSESQWTRFGALVESNGGVWQGNETKIKAWAKTHSNNMGYAVSDTRTAASTLLQSGLAYNQLGTAMNGVAGLAARTGQTQAEASTMIATALNGRFNALSKVTGLQKEDFLDANGNIDKMKLLTTLYNQNKNALDAHSNTTEAAIARLQNAWSGFKTSIGQALLPVIQIVASVATQIVNMFNGLPGPIKTGIAVLIGLGGAVGVALGALGFLAPALINVGTMIKTVSNAGKIASVAMRGMSLAARLSGAGMLADSYAKTANVIATDADAAANISLSTSLRLAATGFYQLAVAILTNPITWIAIAIIAFIAIMWHLYNTNAEVKKGIDDLANAVKGGLMVAWNGLQTVIQTLWNGLQKLGQTIYNNLIPVWQNLQQMAAPLVQVFYKLYGSLQNLWSALNGGGGDDAANSFNILAAAGQAVGAVIVGLVNHITTVFQIIAAVAMPVITAVVDIFSILIDHVTNVIMIFNLLANGSISVGDAFNFLLQNIISTVGQIGGALLQAGGQIITNIASIFGGIPEAVGAYLATLPTKAGLIFNQMKAAINQQILLARVFIAAQMGLIGMRIYNTLRSIPIRARLAFMQFVNNIRLNLMRAWILATQYANNIKNALINKIQQAVQRVRHFISNIPQTIMSRLSQAASNALSGAKQIYDNIINKIKEIPRQVESELSSLPGKIASALASAASSALSGAANIVASFASGLQRHSPGKIYKDTLDEFSHVIGVINDSTPEAARQTNKMAVGMVDAWQNAIPDALNVPGAMFNNIPSFDVGLNNNDLTVLKSNLNGNGLNTQGMTNNNIMNMQKDDHTNHVHIENITLQCNDLSKQESRRILYNALDGLYMGGA